MRYDLVSIVASPRGLPALRHLLSELPSGFASPIACLVQAYPALVDELRAVSRLKVQWARAGDRVERGTVYLSAPGTSLVCMPDGTLGLSPFGAESSALDPVDTFLISAANAQQRKLLTLVLAGFDRDGVIGCDHVKRVGGTVLVLDRATARYWGMAESIVKAGAVDRILTIDEVAEALRGCFTSQDLLRCAEIQIELGTLLETAMRMSGTGMGHITRRIAGSDRLHIIVQRGLGIDFFEHFEAMSTDRDTAWCRAVRSMQPVAIPDVAKEPAHPGHRLERLPYRAEFAVPLLTPKPGHEAHGALTTLFLQSHAPSPHESSDLGPIAREAAELITRIP